MKKVAILLSLIVSVGAQTEVSGIISENTTWTKSNSPYIVTSSIAILEGITLTIEPGVTVKLDSSQSLKIYGQLLAKGNSNNRIKFTSNSLNPSIGDWGNIHFTDTSIDGVLVDSVYSSGSTLQYCDIEFEMNNSNVDQVRKIIEKKAKVIEFFSKKDAYNK